MPFKRLFDKQSAASASPKRERRKEARPGELLEAALALFVEKGFAATRAEEVAARAGVSKGTLFLYFPSKEELFKAVVRENISGRFGQWSEMARGFRGTAADMMHTCVDAWWERVGSTQASGISKLMFSEARNFPELAAFYQQEVVAPGHAILCGILRRGIDSGEFRPVDDVDHAVYGLIAPMVFLMMWKHTDGVCGPPGLQMEPVKFLHQQVDLLVSGLAVRPGKADG